MQATIISVITFILFYISYRGVKGQDLKKLFLFYSLYFGILGFFFKPNIAYDLYMHYGYLDATRKYGLVYLQTNGKTVGLYTYQLLFYVFSKLPIDNFLGMFTAFVINYLPLMVIYHYAKDCSLKKRETILIAMFFLCAQNYIALVSNVRTPLTYAVFIYVMYWELCNKKFRIPAAFCYLALVFLHPSVLLPIGLRYIFAIKRRKVKRVMLILLLGWFTSLPYLIDQTSNLSGLLGYISSMLYEYSQDFARNAHNIQANLTYTLRMVTTSMLALFILYYRYIHTKKIKSDFFEYIYLGMAFVMFGGIGASYHFFLRFGSFLVMCSCFPLTIIMSKQFRNKKVFFQLLKVASVFALLSNLVLQYRTAEFAFYIFG